MMDDSKEDSKRPKTLKFHKQELTDFLFGIEELWRATDRMTTDDFPENLKREQLKKILKIYDIHSDEAFNNKDGEFCMFTDFYYYNMMRN